MSIHISDDIHTTIKLQSPKFIFLPIPQVAKLNPRQEPTVRHFLTEPTSRSQVVRSGEAIDTIRRHQVIWRSWADALTDSGGRKYAKMVKANVE